MFFKLCNNRKKVLFFDLALITVMTLVSCGREQEIKNQETEITIDFLGENKTAEDEDTTIQASLIGEIDTVEDVKAEDIQTDEIKMMFGENCISEQTFEVELSQYSGKVYFVPFAPSQDSSEFYMQIVQDGEVLNEIEAYVPEGLSGKFSSLDAVAFYDVNFDDNTDIVLIETYGDKSFAAVYYGFVDDASDYSRYFISKAQLSEKITSQVETLTISEIRNFLSGGKKNGEFIDYREAYKTVSRLYELEHDLKDRLNTGYDLIYFDDDDIPELVAGQKGYFVSLYTYHNGKIYVLMDDWGYGAFGNAGYEYSPRKNSLSNYNQDYAGLIGYSTYMTMNNQYSLETVVQIVTYNFDDANGNGVPDKDEESSVGYYSVSYIDGEEVTSEEYASYSVGEYKLLYPEASLEELEAKLNK